MSTTLLAIDTHAAVSPFLPDMWPHYERAGIDIVGIQRTNLPTKWPHNCKGHWHDHVPVISVGEDIFKRWCEHQNPTLLPLRMLDTIERLLNHPQFDKYTDFCLSSWSVLFCRPLPQPMPAPLILTLTGGAQYDRGFSSPYLFHHPRWMNRDMAKVILQTGHELLRQGKTERGADDFFLGLIVATAGLKWFNAPGLSMNSLETPKQIADARIAIKSGAWYVGNVKNKQELTNLLNGIALPNPGPIIDTTTLSSAAVHHAATVPDTSSNALTDT